MSEGPTPRSPVDVEDDVAFSSTLSGEKVVPGDDPSTPPGEDFPPWTGKQMGHFKLLRPLGSGSMGRVIQAVDVNLQRLVALKVLRRRATGPEDDRRVAQFLREARAAAQIEHPGIVRVFEIAQHEGWWYLAMEMVDGQTLEEIVNAAGALPQHKACSLIADIAGALAAAHEFGVIHRDIKPSNVMVTRTGRGKITDFGLARVNNPDDPFDFTGKSVGTPKYMSPEAIQQKPADYPIDIYGLGGTLWFALTGHPPFAGKSVMTVLNNHLHEPVPEPLDAIPGCSRSLASLLRMMLDKNPLVRPTAAEVAASLRGEMIAHTVDGSGSQASAAWSAVFAKVRGGDAATRRVRGRVAWGLTAAAAVALAVAATVWVVDAMRAPPTLESRFPPAPASYGASVPTAPPLPNDLLLDPPPFSWVGRVDVTGLNFAASRRGTRYWPIDGAEAVLIRAEDFVGYKTEGEARADGKVPAKK